MTYEILERPYDDAPWEPISFADDEDEAMQRVASLWDELPESRCDTFGVRPAGSDAEPIILRYDFEREGEPRG